MSPELFRGKESRRSGSRKKRNIGRNSIWSAIEKLDAVEFRVFRYIVLLGADWKPCCRQHGMDRSKFFHAVYRIEPKLGRVFAELEPMGCIPWTNHFGGWISEPAHLLPPPVALCRPKVAYLTACWLHSGFSLATDEH